MGQGQEVIIRLVPDRMNILHSRERTPFMLFIETLECSSSSVKAGSCDNTVENNNHLMEQSVACFSQRTEVEREKLSRFGTDDDLKHDDQNCELPHAEHHEVWAQKHLPDQSAGLPMRMTHISSMMSPSQHHGACSSTMGNSMDLCREQMAPLFHISSTVSPQVTAGSDDSPKFSQYMGCEPMHGTIHGCLADASL